MDNSKVFLKSVDEILRSLLADDSKNKAMINDIEKTVSQLKAKNSFRLALINQLIENNLNQGLTNEYNTTSRKTSSN